MLLRTGATGIRTLNLQTASLTLYQLSYDPLWWRRTDSNRRCPLKGVWFTARCNSRYATPPCLPVVGFHWRLQVYRFSKLLLEHCPFVSKKNPPNLFSGFGRLYGCFTVSSTKLQPAICPFIGSRIIGKQRQDWKHCKHRHGTHPFLFLNSLMFRTYAELYTKTS